MNRAGWLGLILLATLPVSSFAGRVGAYAGYYTLSADSGSTGRSSSLSGFGSYNFFYRHSVSERIEVDASYSLLTSEIAVGDLAFGFDVAMNYYFLAPAKATNVNSSGVSLTMRPIWNPFFGAGFSQRNFQSTSVQYAGPQIRLGVEYFWRPAYSLTVLYRWLSLGGPNSSNLTQSDLLLGVQFQF